MGKAEEWERQRNGDRQRQRNGKGREESTDEMRRMGGR